MTKTPEARSHPDDIIVVSADPVLVEFIWFSPRNEAFTSRDSFKQSTLPALGVVVTQQDVKHCRKMKNRITVNSAYKVKLAQVQ